MKGTEVQTIADLRQWCKENDNYFFTPDTMKFFGSRIMSGLYKNGCFIMSQYTSFDRDKRHFVVWNFDREKERFSCGHIAEFKYLSSAREFAKTYIKGE